MKLILISDLHLLWDNPVARKDLLRETQFKKLDFIWSYAQENNAVVLQAGDFFNRPRSWYLLPEVINFLKSYPDVEVYAVYGGRNHDTYMYSNETRHNTNLGILERSGLVKILGNREVDTTQALLYGCSFGEEVPKPDGNLKDGTWNVLVIHAPIYTKKIPFLEDSIVAKDFLKEHKDYDLILCADIHRKFIVRDGKRMICNTGPILRRTAEEYSFSHEPCFFVYDTEKGDLEEIVIPYEPADKVLDRDHIDRKQEVESILDDFVSEYENEFEAEVDIYDNLKKIMEVGKLSKNTENIIYGMVNK